MSGKEGKEEGDGGRAWRRELPPAKALTKVSEEDRSHLAEHGL